MKRVRLQFLLVTSLACGCWGQSAAPAGKPPADVLVFGNGDKLTGQILSADGASVTFSSEVAGTVTIPWAKVSSVQSATTFVAIPKGVDVSRKSGAGEPPHGTLALDKQDLQLRANASVQPKTVPLSQVAAVIPEGGYTAAMKPVSLFSGWHGKGTFGFDLTRSSQDIRNINTGFYAGHNSPGEAWQTAKYKTSVSFNLVSSKFTSGGNTIDVSVYNALVEQDYYVKPRLFLFGLGWFEHNNSQGLDLRQNYGAGAGYMAVQREKQSLELDWSFRFSNQKFTVSSFDRNIVGGRLTEFYTYKFQKGAVFSAQGWYAPAFNYSKGYFTGFSSSLSVPIFKRLGVQIMGKDDYLNDPPPGFKKNSLQTGAGLTYTF